MLVKMEVYQGGNTGCAKGPGEDIFTQAETADELLRNSKEAVTLPFENGTETAEGQM
jgi:hypothetical protein